MEKKQKSQHHAAIGRKGGLANAKKHGRDHMAKIGRKGWKALVSKLKNNQ